MSFNFVEAEFNLWSPDYDSDAQGRGHYLGHAKVAEHIRRWTGNIAASSPTLVDLGTGTGLVLEELRHHFRTATMRGFDISAGMLKKCREKNIADALIVCNLEDNNWPIEKGSADIVTSAGLLDFITNPDHFLANTHMIMKPGAIAALTYEVRERVGRKGASLPTASSSPRCSLSAEEMRAMAGDKGFTILDEESFRGYAYYGKNVTYGLMVLQKPFPG